MSNHSCTVTVDQPVRNVYNQWTQFETFPQFMEGVEEVTQLSDRRLHWKVDIGGVLREFDAEIVEQIPDERIAWRTTDGPYQAGDVSFRQVGPAKTEVTLGLEFEPHGLAEKAGDALGFVSRRIEGDLDRFKSFVEQYGQTGAYRGRV